MSYQEKNITVSLMSSVLILGFYLLNLLPMYQEGNLNAPRVFSLWATVILTAIVATIVASILAHIMLSIVQAIKTRTEESESFIADERDKLIELKGMRNSHIVFSLGTLLSMLTFVFGQPPLVMFSLLIFFTIAASIVGDLSQLYFYRK